MKIVINENSGSFYISDDLAEKVDLYNNDRDARTNPNVIAAVESDPDWASGEGAWLTIVEIPDNATDWEIENEDWGPESVIYVINGKIHHV